MTVSLRIVMLLTDGFGGIGGIAKFNRDFLQALNRCVMVERVRALPRLIAEPIVEEIPEAVVYDRKAARRKLTYMLRVLALAWRRGPLDVVICGHLYMLPIAWILARLRGARLALIIHGIEAWQAPNKFFASRLAGKVDSLISVSRFSAERFASWSKIPVDRVYILPNSVNLERFRPQKRDLTLAERYGLSGKTIVTMGRLASEERYKGFDQVIEIMPELRSKFPSIKYLIIGGGRDRRRLEAKVAALKLSDSVIFTGYISESDKVAHFNLADAYVMPSSGEGFGIVLIEAAACGVPVVGSRVDGSREALLDGVLGRLVDPTNKVELLEAVTMALNIASLGSRNRMIETFSFERFSKRVDDWCAAMKLN